MASADLLEGRNLHDVRFDWFLRFAAEAGDFPAIGSYDHAAFRNCEAIGLAVHRGSPKLLIGFRIHGRNEAIASQNQTFAGQGHGKRVARDQLAVANHYARLPSLMALRVSDRARWVFCRSEWNRSQVVNTVLLQANAFAGPSIAFHEQYPHVAMPVHREKGVRLSS